MIGMRFVDTNILLYRISTDPSEESKAEIAAEVLAAKDLCLSVQVLQEFYVQATRSSRKAPLTHEDTISLIEKWKRFSVQPVTLELMENAFLAKLRWGLSYRDSAILEAARLQKCTTVLSEDLSHGQDYGGVTVINPFLAKEAGGPA